MRFSSEMMKVLTISLAALFLIGCPKKETEAPKDAPKEATKTDEKKADEKKVEAPKEDPGNWVTVDAYGVKFRAPDGWKVSTDGSTSTATDPDGTTTAMLIGSESSEFAESALENIKKQVKFEDVDLKRSGLTTINGMPGYSANGTAVLVKGEDKQEIQFLMNSVKVGDKAAALLIFAEAEMYEARKEEIDGLSKTLTKK